MDTPPDYAIRPLTPRRNGWTPERQAAFLTALAETANVTAAARRVRMTPQSAHWLRRQPAAQAFRDGWAAALAETVEQVSACALDRIIEGEVRIIERNGVSTVLSRPCAPGILIRLLDRATAARERADSVRESGKLGK